MRLRPFDRPDFDRLRGQFASKEELRAWSGNYFRFPLDSAQIRDHWQATSKSGSALLLCAELSGTEGFAGYGELSRFTVNQSAFLSRVLVPKNLRGQGFSVHFVHSLLGHAFGTLGLHRVELNVYEKNEAALRCYERVGFIREGLLRDALSAGNGVYWSEFRMSILKHEYPG